MEREVWDYSISAKIIIVEMSQNVANNTFCDLVIMQRDELGAEGQN